MSVNDSDTGNVLEEGRADKIDSSQNVECAKKIETEDHRVQVVYKLRDRNKKLVLEWETAFSEDIKKGHLQVSHGDIFHGAPSAVAIVSPANSFGFMDGGIDMAYSMHFGWQMQHRLQSVIREKYNGELLVGQAEIITTMESGDIEASNLKNWKGCNEDKPIKYLISAPTMRVPLNVDDTANAYLAFRAIILAVEKFNKESPHDMITSVLCPGLGTAVGRMPADRCAFQMKEAYDTYVVGNCYKRIHPSHLAHALFDMENMQLYERKPRKN